MRRLDPLSIAKLTTWVASVFVVFLSLAGAQSQEREEAAISRQSDVIYGRKDGMALTMEVFQARNGNGLGVIWIVSSSGRSSRATTLRSSYQRRFAPFLNKGFSVFAVIHGSAPVYHLQDYVEDANRAVRYIRYHADEFGVDPDRLAIAGSSAGGNIALMIATQGGDGDRESDDPVERVSSRVQAAGAFFAPTDFLNFGEANEDILDFLRRKYGPISSPFQFYDADKKTGARKFIEEPSRIREMLGEYSPISYVSGDDPPTILIHGDADTVIPIQQSRRLSERLSRANVATRLVVREQKSHGWPGWESDCASIADWFEEHLR